MKKDFKEFIKQLSLSDPKTLSQKALKTSEEVGELAKSVLPYDSAPGTNHRFVDKHKILEEVADIYLTSISIAYSIGFEDSDIEEMIYRKSQKWSEIQSRERDSSFPLPFEIHITVDGCEMRDPIFFDRKKFDIDEFKVACNKIGVKPIVLDLEANSTIIKDHMTSSKHFGDNKSAYLESQRIFEELEKFGFDVVRTKIETVPWHPAAPRIGEHKNGCYFESHIGVIISQDEKNYLNLFIDKLKDKEFVELSGKAKLSRNFFKKSEDGKFINMLTYRSDKVGKPTFELEVETIKQLLSDNGFEFEKVEIEYSIYDTNVSHDTKWINS